MRALMAILLTGTTLHAQDQALAGPKQVPQKPVPRVETFTRFTELRQGRTEDVAVELIAKEFLLSPRSQLAGVEPVSLTLDPEPGLRVLKMNYPKNELTRKFKFQTEPIKMHGSWLPVEIKLRVEDTAAFGLHTIRGKFTYQEISDAGVSGIKQIDVMLPVTVVGHNAKVSKSTEWPFYHMSTAAIIGLIALCIVLLPLFIVLLPIIIATGGWD